ncbi:MAG: SH3 domain-containing protein [Myxococcales bacterium]|nr:SH3 domain-containing protein [Myxococcales bacterium]
MLQSRTTRWIGLSFVALLAVGCVGQVGNVATDDEVSEVGDPEPDDADRTIAANFGVGTTVAVCNVRVGLNCRSGPSTSYRILRTMPGGTKGKVLSRSGSWHKLDLGDGQCWSYGGYLCASSGAPGTPVPPSQPPAPQPSTGAAGSSGWKLPAPYHLTPDGIVATGRAFTGFSYWWGGARLPNPWQTAGKSRGTCRSSTYSGHSGTYGADCSGFVGMIWQLPTANSFESNSHPYSTYQFYYNRTYWSALDRGNVRKGDAMVYRSSSGGHIFVTTSVSSWGKHNAVEARGCSYGIVYNLRSVSSSYRARRRNGV